MLPPVELPAAHITDQSPFCVWTTVDFPLVLDAVADAMRRHGYPVNDTFAVRLALEEALVNAVKHGHGYDPSKAVRVHFRVTTEEVLAEVEDEGPGFDLADVA